MTTLDSSSRQPFLNWEKKLIQRLPKKFGKFLNSYIGFWTLNFAKIGSFQGWEVVKLRSSNYFLVYWKEPIVINGSSQARKKLNESKTFNWSLTLFNHWSTILTQSCYLLKFKLKRPWWTRTFTETMNRSLIVTSIKDAQVYSSQLSTIKELS